ncbi:CP [Cordyline virus 1]|uniref:CP n=1 Tax=Cordyline virus 1 TaxID=937809 RepID=E7CT68_9CLOS|nr:CP [Cordyline virus 1]ADU03660.1 CP [Cordyline virus 1]
MAHRTLSVLFTQANNLYKESLKPAESRVGTYNDGVTSLINALRQILDTNPTFTAEQKRSLVTSAIYPDFLPTDIVSRLKNLLTDSRSVNTRDIDKKKNFSISDLIQKGVKLPTFKTQPQAANELTKEQVEFFYASLEEYFKYQVYNKGESEDLTDDENIAFIASYFASLIEQSTSRENANNKNLLNTFTLNDIEYTWDRAKFLRFIDAKFSEKGYKVENIERRFGRSEFDKITAILQKVDYKPSERLPTQWGVLDNTRAQISDFAAVYKSTSTPKSQSAQVAASEYATSRRGDNNTAVHVSQVLGRNNLQRR